MIIEYNIVLRCLKFHQSVFNGFETEIYSVNTKLGGYFFICANNINIYIKKNKIFILKKNNKHNYEKHTYLFSIVKDKLKIRNIENKYINDNEMEILLFNENKTTNMLFKDNKLIEVYSFK